MAPVISICGLKGGIAKTSTAIALATAMAEQGPTLLVDADPNGSALRWHRRGEGALPFECCSIQAAPMAMQRPWDLVVVDTAGGAREEQMEYAKGSTLVIAPCQAAASSLEQVLDLVELVRPTGVDLAVLMTMVDSRRKGDATRAKALLEAQGITVLDTMITMLSAWPKAEAQGVAVRDAKADSGRPDSGAGRAWEEVTALHQEIASRIERGQTTTLRAA